MQQKKEGSLRLMTQGEIKLAKEIFKDTILYYKVWIHHASYLPFGLQHKEVAMAPNGELYFRNWYRADFSRERYELQHLFIHEMSHVWQRARGMNIFARGTVSWAVSYRYHLNGRPLRCYPMEQQAQIIADYFLLSKHGYRIWLGSRDDKMVTYDGDISEECVQESYQKTLSGFPWSYQ